MAAILQMIGHNNIKHKDKTISGGGVEHMQENEEYTQEFIERMQEIMSEKPIFVGTAEELDKFLDTLDYDD